MRYNYYTCEYATSLEEAFNLVSNKTYKIGTIPSISLFKDVFDTNIDFNYWNTGDGAELWQKIYTLFKDEICIITDEKPSASTIKNDSIKFWDKFYTIWLTSKVYYTKLINVLKDKENSLMAQIGSSTESENRFNDTPYNKGNYNDSQYTTTITRNKTTSLTDGGTPLERIDEIRRRYTDYYTRWAYEFESLFISPLNYDFIELEEDE